MGTGVQAFLAVDFAGSPVASNMGRMFKMEKKSKQVWEAEVDPVPAALTMGKVGCVAPGESLEIGSWGVLPSSKRPALRNRKQNF